MLNQLQAAGILTVKICAALAVLWFLSLTVLVIIVYENYLLLTAIPVGLFIGILMFNWESKPSNKMIHEIVYPDGVVRIFTESDIEQIRARRALSLIEKLRDRVYGKTPTSNLEALQLARVLYYERWHEAPELREHIRVRSTKLILAENTVSEQTLGQLTAMISTSGQLA